MTRFLCLCLILVGITSVSLGVHRCIRKAHESGVMTGSRGLVSLSRFQPKMIHKRDTGNTDVILCKDGYSAALLAHVTTTYDEVVSRRLTHTNTTNSCSQDLRVLASVNLQISFSLSATFSAFWLVHKPTSVTSLKG